MTPVVNNAVNKLRAN